ncbi:hypothetical protein BDM02DRAFT_3193301 [Thelephora ganbajun]|uniref:Uncharacterized protein n=1 Tax=Thelephora ganbajun TaxID=370292 RepID=A0ACB6YZ38_THEGA|nr:hypothetical protein BDM02DRAFT_3193301 [Thelephora ganbajun]
MGAVLYPGAGYTEAILSGHNLAPGHASIIINGDQWEFHSSIDSKYANRKALLETIYASGYFKHENPDYDPENLPFLNIKSLLASSLVSMTGNEFYNNIPSTYGYVDHFHNYTKEIHAIPYPGCWARKAYITCLEIPKGTPDAYGASYCIHPSILDSITQISLCMFMNMTNKTFNFNSTFLPVSMKRLTCWDPVDALSMEEHLKKGVYILYKPKAGGAKGPFISDYIISDASGKVFFTIDKFERIVTTWQPKAFITPNHTLPPVGVHGGHSYSAEVLESFLLLSLLATHQFAVNYFTAGIDGESADTKTASVNVILTNLNISKTPINLELVPRLLAPSGVTIFLIHSGAPSEEEGFSSLTIQEFASKLEALSAQDIQAQQLPAGQSVIVARNFTPPSFLFEELTTNMITHHFLHRNKGELIEKVKTISTEAELWIVGNNNAASIGALGVAAALIAEEPQFTVHSVLFEDTTLSVKEHEGWIHTIRQNPKVLSGMYKFLGTYFENF